MLKRNSWLCFLLILAMSGSPVFAGGNTNPYASIVVFNAFPFSSDGQSPTTPNMETLSGLNIINMTPWDISIGTNGNENNFPGMVQLPNSKSTASITPFYLRGINKSNGSFAFRSVQMPLVNPNTAWITKSNGTNIPKDNYGRNFLGSTNYISVPIVFNSQNSNTSPSNTAALSFMVTSSTGFATSYQYNNTPSPALSYGDGGNNSFAWQSASTSLSPSSEFSSGNLADITNFFTIQALTGGTNWAQITPRLAATTTNTVNGVAIQSPNYLNVSGLAYPNFSNVAGDKGGFDLVVILQSGDYAHASLLFLAIPNTSDLFLPSSSAAR